MDVEPFLIIDGVRYYDVSGAATLLRISARTLARRVAARKIGCLNADRTLFTDRHLTEYLERSERMPLTPLRSRGVAKERKS